MSRSLRRWSKVRKKWVLATPLCPLSKRGMRTPKPIGMRTDTPETVAQRIAECCARAKDSVHVWVLDDAIYAVRRGNVYNEAFRSNPRARLHGVVRYATPSPLPAE